MDANSNGRAAGWSLRRQPSNWWIKTGHIEDNEREGMIARKVKPMPSSPLSVVIQQLRADLGPDSDGLTDGELLARFVSSRDEQALAALVRRHASLVWGVCCRLLDHHDAEDAFQATFLVLVRKAANVPEQAVANWLYGVARQTAIRLRATEAKRGWREMQVEKMPEPTVPVVHDADLKMAVDEELSHLPDHYRGVIVLCDLEGLTRKEAARQLAIPEGSVASRLARARAMLAKRLNKRGIVFSGSVAGVLSPASAVVSAPPALVASTIKTACLLAAGQAAGVVAVKVTALTEGVITAMYLTKLKSLLALVLILVVGVAGTSLILVERVGGASLTSRLAAQDGKKSGAEGTNEANKPTPKDLSKIEPPGGIPLSLVKPGTRVFGVDQLNKVSERLLSVPEKDLEQWVVELERIIDVKLKDGQPSPRQACRTDFVVRLSVAFNDLRWNAETAGQLYKRACSMKTAEANAWKAAFESVLKKKIGIEQTGKDEFSQLAGGPPWAVPLVLIPVDALHEGQKYSVEHGKRYLVRLKQLTQDDVALWRDKIDQFGGSELDAAINIILLDEFFTKEEFRRDKFRAAIKRHGDKKPVAEKPVEPTAKLEKEKEAFTAWGKEIDGLQAGLGFRPGQKRAYRHGEEATVVLRVRNVGKEAVEFKHIWAFFVENAPTVRDADGKVVKLPRVTAEGLQMPRSTAIAPGEEAELYQWSLDLPPKGASSKNRLTIHGTGKFSLQCERIVGPTSGNPNHPNPTLEKLATGKLELEVKDAPPGKQKVLTPEEAVKVAGDSKLEREFNESKSAVEFKVQFVARAILVKASGGKDAAWVHGHSPDDVCLGILVPKSPVVADDPLKRDHIRFVATLTGKVIGQLQKAGIKDLEKHYQGRSIQVTGEISRHEYDGLRTPSEVEIVIDDLGQLAIMD